MTDAASLRANIEAIHDSIRATAKHAMLERTPSPTLIAVSKRQPDARIEAALAAGQRVFGENQVQEAENRWTPRRTPGSDLELHLIGPLQTNKVDRAVALFDVIQTVDRIKLADKIKAAADKQAKTPRLFIQVNTGAEDQKAGVALSELEGLLNHMHSIGLHVEGLMCIPPVEDDAALHFALLKKLAKRHGLKGLSMGMSGDYDVAATMGATHIRVGTAVFGSRDS